MRRFNRFYVYCIESIKFPYSKDTNYAKIYLFAIDFCFFDLL